MLRQGTLLMIAMVVAGAVLLIIGSPMAGQDHRQTGPESTATEGSPWRSVPLWGARAMLVVVGVLQEGHGLCSLAC